MTADGKGGARSSSSLFLQFDIAVCSTQYILILYLANVRFSFCGIQAISPRVNVLKKSTNFSDHPVFNVRCSVRSTMYEYAMITVL